MSRNRGAVPGSLPVIVAPREGRVSRNPSYHRDRPHTCVAPREGRVSRNVKIADFSGNHTGRAPRGACE